MPDCAVVLSGAEWQAPQYHRESLNTPEALRKLAKKRSPHGEVQTFCYEAGHVATLSIGISRRWDMLEVMTLSFFPQNSRDRVRTDRRGPLQLARLY